MKKYDIVLVDFPFSDLSQSKLRPALVVATPGGDNHILCQITTKKRTINTYEIELPSACCTGDIRFDSNVYVDMMFTIHKSIVRKQIGFIHDHDTKNQVSIKIKNLFS